MSFLKMKITKKHLMMLPSLQHNELVVQTILVTHNVNFNLSDSEKSVCTAMQDLVHVTNEKKN